MSRRAHAADRCARCRLHKSVCVCASIPRIETSTRLVLVMHRDEERKPTNTGRLAALCLPNSEVLVRGGDEGEPSLVLRDDRQPVFLFPHEDAVPIARFANGPRPLTLIVPDGTWRQASKMRRRMPGLAGVPCVSLPEGDDTSYRLRAEPRDGGLATMEAIARAFGLVENAAAEAEMLRIFRVMVTRTLWIRGVVSEREVEGGLPEGATRDPLSFRNRSE